MSYTGIFSVDPFFDDSALSDVETEDQRLCRLCRSITISGIRRVFVHHRNHRDLINSSESCDSCYLLARTLVESPVLRWRYKHHPPPSPRSIRERLYRIIGRNDGNRSQDVSPAVRIQDSRNRPEGASPDDANRHGLNQVWVTCGTLNQEFRMYATSIRTSAKWRIPRPMNPDSGSAAALDLVRSWNQKCSKTHKCEIEPSVLPTRVIDVGPADGSQGLFLYVTKGETGHWISLSHRWGTQPIITTDLANFGSMCCGIELGALPKTFQDSVKLTRQMGIRYLWIDSICIIQDSYADWEAEASKMADIYKRAYLTVVAASASDSHEGFFMNRPPLEDAPAGLVFSNAGTLVKVFNGTAPGAGPSGLSPERESNVVDTRAWCLQEEALSTRLLKYNRTHMSWHCAGWSEMHEDGRQEYSYATYHRVPTILESADGEKASHRWHSILTNYTGRHMTFPSDKLPALAGIATEFHRQTGDEYLAGLWRSHLPLGLLWHVSQYRSDPQTQRSDKYRAPSWSWACLDGHLDFSMCTSNLELEPSLKIVDATIAKAGTNPFGQVLGGSLSVQGKLKVAKCGDESPANRNYMFKIVLLDLSSSSSSSSSSSGESRVVGHGYFDIADEQPANQARVWCLQISTLQGLLLVPDRGDESELRRIGLFRLVDNGGWFEDCPVTTIKIT